VFLRPELLIDVLVTGSSFLNRDWKSARFLLNGGEELNKDSKEVTIGGKMKKACSS